MVGEWWPVTSGRYMVAGERQYFKLRLFAYCFRPLISDHFVTLLAKLSSSISRAFQVHFEFTSNSLRTSSAIGHLKRPNQVWHCPIDNKQCSRRTWKTFERALDCCRQIVCVHFPCVAELISRLMKMLPLKHQNGTWINVVIEKFNYWTFSLKTVLDSSHVFNTLLQHRGHTLLKSTIYWNHLKRDLI